MLEEILKDTTKDLFENLDNLVNVIEENKPIKFYRKFRVRKRIKKRYMIRYNPAIDLLSDNLSFALRILRRHFNEKNI